MTTALLMEFEGADGSTTFVDDSGLAKTVTVVGAAAISTDHALYGSSSVELLNLGDYLRIEQSAGELETASDWSLHIAYRRAGLDANRTLLSTTDDRISINSDGSGLNMNCRISDGINVTLPSWSAPSQVWGTVGLSCRDGEVRLLVDGLLRHTRAFVGGVNFNNLGLGRHAQGGLFSSGQWGGWADKLLIDRSAGLWRWRYDPMTLVPDDTLIYSLIDRAGAAQGHAPVWPATPRLISRQHRLRRVDYGGLGKVCGTVKIKGLPDAPVRRIVRLVRERDAVTVAEQWSDPVTGAYEFTGFALDQKYTVLAYDLAGGFRAAIASGVTPAPMTV